MSPKGLESLLPREKLSKRPSTVPSRYPSGTIWPHGEWSLGYASEAPADSEWHENPLQVSQRAEEGIRGDWALARFPLNLSDAPNSQTRPPRGQNGITGYGQQMVKACGFLMGDLWPQHRKTLGTITLPEMSDEARKEVVAAWPELTRQLLQHLSGRLAGQGLPPVVCSVTEVQPRRLTETGQGCLHWHLLWLNTPGRKGNWSVEPCGVRTWLESLLNRKIPSYQGGHVNVNVKPVRGDAARYLAKYMSKGKQQVAEAMEDWGEGLCPRTWWNMTKPARDMVKARTSKGREPGTLLDAILEHAWATDIDAHFDYLRHIEIVLDGVAITVGWRGRFTRWLREGVKRVLESGDITGFGVALAA